MVEKDNRRIEKEEMSRGDASNEDCVKNKKRNGLLESNLYS